MESFDFIIVGGGPNGLCAAYELGKTFPGKRIRILEKGRILNNIRQFPDVLWHSRMKELKLPSYLNRAIDDSYNPVSSELVAYYTHFAREHRLDIREECEVTDIRRDGDGYTIDTLGNVQERTLFSAKTILLCTGIYENNRTLSIKSDFDYCSHRFDLSTSGKNLLLLGGGNSAIDYIIHLLPKNKINWVLRSPKWSIVNDVLIQQFNDSMSRNAGNLKMYTNTEVVRLNADRSALLSDGTTLEGIDACTMLLGFNSRNPLFEKIGLEFDHECLKLGDGYETNLPNIYAFGAIMAQWDGKAPKPTFIHNGNMRQLNRIMDHIIAKETGKIFKAPAQPAQSASLPAEAKTRQGLMGLFRKSLRRVLSQ